MSPRTRAALAATLLVVVPGLAACGNDDSGSEDGGGAATAQDPVGETSAAPSESASPSTAPSEPSAPVEVPVTLPACGEVWVVGATVARGYEGCLEGASTVPADGRYCEFGKPLFTYQEGFYAVAGGPVIATERPLLRDPGYRDALKKCGG
ncbi:MAG: hypothetical protein LH468_04875 [Nocardioides sp.]|nr:hypothetical protein [Nocardioides sp.]